VRDEFLIARTQASFEERQRLDELQAIIACRSALTFALGYGSIPAAGSCAFENGDLTGQFETVLHSLGGRWTEPVAAQARQAIQTLDARRDVLNLALRSSQLRIETGNTLRLADLSDKLEADELLIEFVHFSPAVPEPIPHDRDRYGVFLLDSGGALEWIDIGESRQIDDSVSDLIQSAREWSEVVSGGGSGVRALRASERPLQHLSTLLNPLMKSLTAHRRARRLHIAADGLLNMLPFEALSFDGKFLLESYEISYLNSTYDIALAKNADRLGGPPVIVVSPGNRTPSRGVSARFDARSLPWLKSADAEAMQVSRHLADAQILRAARATEENIKHLPPTSLLHLVGNGIYRGENECRSHAQLPGCELAFLDRRVGAMGMAAMFFEEAYGRAFGSPQDGILTALELQVLDLNGMRMLFLSQCRMADGFPSSGEGVYGMRRAAFLAGVDTLVAPVWNIADKAQVKLVDEFYAALSHGDRRAEALRKAKLALLRNSETSSFLYWAPVILTGDASPMPRSLFVRGSSQ
jgi:CHAT domain-containing protein